MTRRSQHSHNNSFIPLSTSASNVRYLLQLFCNIWSTTAEVPQDFKDATIVTIYKRKGDRAECGNHRGISLLSVAGKILAKILQHRLQSLAEDILPESQCGFRANRSSQDMIFTLRQLQEKSAEQRQPFIVIFVDFSKISARLLILSTETHYGNY